MCNLQAPYEPKKGNADNQEKIVLNILLSSGGMRALNVMMKTIYYYSHLLLVTGRRSYLATGD